MDVLPSLWAGGFRNSCTLSPRVFRFGRSSLWRAMTSEKCSLLLFFYPCYSVIYS